MGLLFLFVVWTAAVMRDLPHSQPAAGAAGAGAVSGQPLAAGVGAAVPAAAAGTVSGQAVSGGGPAMGMNNNMLKKESGGGMPMGAPMGGGMPPAPAALRGQADQQWGAPMVAPQGQPMAQVPQGGVGAPGMGSGSHAAIVGNMQNQRRTM